MPAFVTHALFGELVRGCLPHRQRLLLEAHPAPFYWGLQGPDLLFFRVQPHRGNPIPRAGSRLHRRCPCAQLEALVRYIRRQQRRAPGTEEVLLSYLMGYVCHYILDVTAHPYVYAMQERAKNDLPKEEWGGIHFCIESDIDTALCPILGGVPLRRYRLRPTCTEAECAALGRMLRHMVWDVLGEEYSTKDMMLCFRDCRRLVGAALDRTGLARPLAQGAERLVHRPNSLSAHVRRARVERDVLNERHGLWMPLYDEDDARTASLFDLLEEAADRAVDGVCAWYDAAVTGQLPDWSAYPPYNYGSPDDRA